MDDLVARAIIAAGVGSTWKAETTQHLAELEMPEQVFRECRALLVGDARFIWLRWYISSIVDADRVLDDPLANHGDVYRTVLDGLRATTDLSGDDLKHLGKLLAREVSDSVEQLRKHRARAASSIERDRLIAESSGVPRCWICGYAFDEMAIDRFLGLTTTSTDCRKLPEWIDRFKPFGMKAVDYEVQVDHVHPFSQGGADSGENLKLCCGWCNATKGARLGLYDGSLYARVLRIRDGRSLSVPRAFWTVRLLALRGRCEDTSGCHSMTADAALSVNLKNPHGAAVPQNLLVLCENHNQRADRFVRRNEMAKIRDAVHR